MISNQFAEARVGTLIFRFKDCVALVELDYVKNITGWTLPTVAQWMWVKKVANKLDRINKTGQEFDQADSYYPFMMELRLCEKSAVSATVNQNMHYFVIGTTLGFDRSKNARMIGECDVTNIMQLLYLMHCKFEMPLKCSTQNML
jgi:hypothetical protein